MLNPNSQLFKKKSHGPCVHMFPVLNLMPVKNLPDSKNFHLVLLFTNLVGGTCNAKSAEFFECGAEC